MRLTRRNLGRAWRHLRGLPLGEHVIIVRPWRVAYFRVPKAANTSIKKALTKSLSLPAVPGLTTTRDKYWRTVDPDVVDLVRPRVFAQSAEFADYWSFAVVREPAARLLSCYKNKIKRNTRLSPPFAALGFRLDMSMEEFVRHACGLPDEQTDVHLQSQASILLHQGRLLPSLVVQMENLPVEWSRVRRGVAAHCGAKLSRLGHANRTDGVRGVSTFGPELSELIRLRYREDYELFYPTLP